MKSTFVGLALLAVMSSVACSKNVDLYCCDSHAVCTPDQFQTCADSPGASGRPFCDISGTYPASNGVAHTCIPTPTGAADAGPDAAIIIDGGMCMLNDAGAAVGCSAPTPACVGETCVQCAVTGDCTVSSPHCETDHTCGACTGEPDCTARTATPHCETTGAATGQCVTCRNNGDCTTGTAPTCDTGTNQCRACAVDTDCNGTGQSGVCNTDAGSCVPDSDVLYVDASASAGNVTCATAATACKTMGAAVALINGVATQHYIKVAAGTYQEAQLLPAKTMTITGTGAVYRSSTNDVPAIKAIGAAMVLTLRGLEVHSAGASTADGVDCLPSSGTAAIVLSHVTVGTAALPDPGIGVNAPVACNVTIEQSTISNNAGGGVSTSGGTLTIEQSTISNNAGGGVSTSGGTLTIEQSTISNNAGGGVSTSNSSFTIVNNFIVKNATSGSLGGVLLSGTVATDSHFSFNTVANNSNDIGSGAGAGVNCSSLTGAGNVSLDNNIVYYVGSSEAQVTATGTKCMNWTYSDIGPVVIGFTATGPNPTPVDPSFVDPTGGNFHLTTGSTLINAADPSAPTTAPFNVDFDGQTRPLGGRDDIGADEVK